MADKPRRPMPDANDVAPGETAAFVLPPELRTGLPFHDHGPVPLPSPKMWAPGSSPGHAPPQATGQATPQPVAQTPLHPGARTAPPGPDPGDTQSVVMKAAAQTPLPFHGQNQGQPQNPVSVVPRAPTFGQAPTFGAPSFPPHTPQGNTQLPAFANQRAPTLLPGLQPPTHDKLPITAEQHASLTAELVARPAHAEQAFARYGLANPQQRTDCDAAWRRRLDAEPELARAWETHFTRTLAWFRRA